MDANAITRPSESGTDALIYTRASMDRHYLMRSTSDQETDCRSWCEQQGWRVARVITDANRSASQWRTREREGFEEALQLIASKQYAAFVTWEPSRAGRELAAYIQLRAACQAAGVLYLTKGRVYDFARSDDAFMMGLEFLTAEKDAAVIRERQLRTVRLNAQKGRPHGRLPYGYRRVYDENTGALLRQEVDPEKAAVITTAVDEILHGVPVNRIITRLNREDIPTPMKPLSDKTRGWMNATLVQIIRSPTIAGLRKYQGEVIGEADWPAIIPVEKWEKVNRVLADRARRTRYVEKDNHSHPKWLLSFIARCGFCGRFLARVHNVVPRKNGRPRNNYVCQHIGCRRISIDVERTDTYVLEALLGWLSTPESLTVLAGPDDDWNDRVREAEERLAALRYRLDEAAEQYAEGAISLAMLSNVEQRLNPQIEQAAREAVPPVADAAVLDLISADDVRAAWERLDLLEQRRLIKMLLEIRIEKSQLMGGIFDYGRIKIAPRFVAPETYNWRRAA
ncbi:recombinase family protein [Agrococcus casei]|uniref:recombinase family protein n=1 Tax=Agrococcus casei TaxID=343512 RepID=UPI000B34DF25|nr:recombinase family protein [Agrococcus casei]